MPVNAVQIKVAAVPAGDRITTILINMTSGLKESGVFFLFLKGLFLIEYNRADEN